MDRFLRHQANLCLRKGSIASLIHCSFRWWVGVLLLVLALWCAGDASWFGLCWDSIIWVLELCFFFTSIESLLLSEWAPSHWNTWPKCCMQCSVSMKMSTEQFILVCYLALKLFPSTPFTTCVNCLMALFGKSMAFGRGNHRWLDLPVCKSLHHSLLQECVQTGKCLKM